MRTRKTVATTAKPNVYYGPEALHELTRNNNSVDDAFVASHINTSDDTLRLLVLRAGDPGRRDLASLVLRRDYVPPDVMDSILSACPRDGALWSEATSRHLLTMSNTAIVSAVTDRGRDLREAVLHRQHDPHVLHRLSHIGNRTIDLAVAGNPRTADATLRRLAQRAHAPEARDLGDALLKRDRVPADVVGGLLNAHPDDVSLWTSALNRHRRAMDRTLIKAAVNHPDPAISAPARHRPPKSRPAAHTDTHGRPAASNSEGPMVRTADAEPAAPSGTVDPWRLAGAAAPAGSPGPAVLHDPETGLTL